MMGEVRQAKTVFYLVRGEVREGTVFYLVRGEMREDMSYLGMGKG